METPYQVPETSPHLDEAAALQATAGVPTPSVPATQEVESRSQFQVQPDNSADAARPPTRHAASESPSLVSQLMAELGLVHAERNRLQAELDVAARTLAYTEGELKSLWGILTGRNVRRAVSYASGQPRDFARLTPETDERARIRAKIMRVRTLARRRRWPWLLMHRSGI